MTAPLINVRIAEPFARAFFRLYGKPSTRSPRRVALPGIQIRPGYFPGSRRSAPLGPYRTRHNWRRRRIPEIGSPGIITPLASVAVPIGSIQWTMPPLDLPESLPQISYGPVRNEVIYYDFYRQRRVTAPQWELQFAIPPARPGKRGSGYRGPPSEEHRRRQDDKLPGFENYLALLRMVNRTYGNYSEFQDLQHALTENSHPLAMAYALAMMEAVDRGYGARAKLLRNQVYSRPFYRLPVGLDTLSRLWQ